MANGFTPLDNTKAVSGFTPLEDEEEALPMMSSFAPQGPGVVETLQAIPGQIAAGFPTARESLNAYLARPEELKTTALDTAGDAVSAVFPLIGKVGKLAKVAGQGLGLVEPDKNEDDIIIRPEWRERVRQNPKLKVTNGDEVYTDEYINYKRKELVAKATAAKGAEANPEGIENSTLARIVGSAAQSIGPSATGLTTFAVTRNPALAMGVGLGSNYALEGASGFQQARGEGADLLQAEKSANSNAIISTVLETAPLGALLREGTKLGKRLLKVGAGEFLQESATSAAQDMESNLAGYTDKAAGDIFQRSIEAGLSGMLGAGVMAPAAQGIHYLHKRQNGTSQPIAEDLPEVEAKGAAKIIAEFTGRINPDYTPPQIPDALTPEQEVEADVRMQQRAHGLKTKITDEGRAFGAMLDSMFGDTTPDVGETSQYVLNRRSEEGEPSKVPHSQRVFGASTDKNMEGLTPMQVKGLSAGVVTTLKAQDDQRNFPAQSERATVDTVQQWVRKYMPNARIIINQDLQYDKNAFASYQRSTDLKGNMIHVITPREMPSLQYQGGNEHTRVAMLTSLSHEFGHAMKMGMFFQGITNRGNGKAGMRASHALQSITKLGQATPKEMQALRAVAPLETALVQEWMDIKSRVESGEMTAKEWQDTWTGPRKHASGMKVTRAADQDAYAWARDHLRAAQSKGNKNYRADLVGKSLENLSAKDLVEIAFPGGASYALNFDEYFAEQVSRAMYAKGDLANSPLNQYFRDVLAKLRDFFRSLKKEGVVKPGEKFEDWLNEALAINQARQRRPRGKQRLPQAVMDARAELVAQARARLGVQAGPAQEPDQDPDLEPEPEYQTEVPPESELSISVDPKVLMVRELEKMVADGVVEEDDPKLKSIRYRISIGEFEAAREKMQALQDDLSYDKEYTTRAIQRLPNKENLKLETLKSLAAQQTLRKQDREALQGIVEQAQSEGWVDWPKQDVIARILEKAVPLKFVPADSIEFPATYYGWAAAGENSSRAQTWIVQAPVWISRSRALGDKASRDHLDDPQGVAHIRMLFPAGESGRAIMGEFQSDLMAKSKGIFEPTTSEYDPLYDPEKRGPMFKNLEAMRDKWHEPVLQEYFAELAEQGMTSVLVPMRTAVIAIQGFTEVMDPQHVADIIKGATLIRYAESGEPISYYTDDVKLVVTGVKIKGETYAGFVDIYDRSTGEKVGTDVVDLDIYPGAEKWYLEGDKRPLIDRIDDLAKSPKIRKILPEKAQQDTVDFYEKTLRGFLKTEGYKTSPTQRWAIDRELDYLEVDLTQPRAKQIVRWDTENPTSPNIPGTVIADVAGTQDQGTQDPASQYPDAMLAWEQSGTNSVFFQRWLGNNQLKEVDTGEPLRYWYRTGQVQLSGTGENIWRLNSNWRNSAWGMKDTRELRDYYVKMENPLRVEATGYTLASDDIEELVREAQTGGFDGVVVTDLGMPFEDTQVLVWNLDQLADGQLSAVPEKVYFDRESETQANTRTVLNGPMGKFIKPVWTPMTALAGKAADMLVQMQQRAIAPLAPGLFDDAMKAMLRTITLAEAFKNNLQMPGEKLAKKLLKVGIPRQQKIYDYLLAEWKADVHWSALAEDRSGALAYQPSALFREKLKEHGIDPGTQEGQNLAKLILEYKNGMQMQFNALEQSLLDQAQDKYEDDPLLIARANGKIRQTFRELYSKPFMPQGHFGNYVLMVKESPKANGKGFKQVLVQHFEHESAFKTAREYWFAKRDENPRRYDVSSKELKDFEGIPVNLPVSMLERLQETGLFEEEQLRAAAEILQPDNIDKISKRFADSNSKTDGASTDFIRNYADFIWHNANFVWKMRFRKNFNQAIQWQQQEIRALHKVSGLSPADRNMLIDKRMRNKKMMERTRDYMLYPTGEFQSIRLWVTLLMLAFNMKTAILNMTTLLNTAAAMTTEYNEIQGTKFMSKAMWDLARYGFDPLSGDKELSPAEFRHRQLYKDMMDKALREGVIDQSYAYFLAGQSTSSAMLRNYRRTMLGNASRQFIETGMWTFRTVEKMNRTVTLTSFYYAEMDRLTKEGVGFESAKNQAYETASAKTMLLQNAYDSGNRAEFLRGKSAVLFIFMSYVQFMTWIMYGGYERGQRAEFRAQGRAVRPWMFGTTAKLWMIFLLLSGLEGIPGGQNILDILTFIWRKLSGGENLELEMRRFFTETGADSNLVMHGLMHDVGGFNLSGSFGLGNIVPGTSLLNKDVNGFTDVVGELTKSLSGPVGGLAQAVFEVVSMTPRVLSGKEDAVELGKAMPGAIGFVSKASDAYLDQQARPTFGVTDKQGARLTRDLETGEFRDLSSGELTGMALGGNPTILAQNREQRFSETSERLYWATRRQDLLRLYRDAVFEKDQSRKEAVNASIQEFNEDIPSRKLRITQGDKNQSVARMKDMAKDIERGRAREQRYNTIVDQVEDAF